MFGFAMRLLAVPALLVLVLGHGGVFEHSTPGVVTTDASSVAAAPEPTPPYISELGPATSQPPRASALPGAGAGNDAAANRPKGLGLALAVVGAALVYISLRLRPDSG